MHVRVLQNIHANVLWKKSCRDLKNVYIRIIPFNFTFPYEVWSVLIEWSQQQIKCDGQPLTVYQVFWLFQLTVILFHCLFHVPVLFHLQIRMGTEKLGNKYLTASGQVRPSLGSVSSPRQKGLCIADVIWILKTFNNCYFKWKCITFFENQSEVFSFKFTSSFVVVFSILNVGYIS